MHAPVLATAFVALSLSAVGCSDSYVDDDHKFRFARQIIPDMTINDGIDVEKGDRTDFKRITPLFDGKVTLQVTVGDPFAGSHGLTGEMGVYTTAPELLDKKAISPTGTKYTLNFEGEAHVSYVFKIEGVSGKAPYQIDYSQEVKPADPCANVSCQDGQVCEEGECVAVETDPPEDTRACPEGCPRGHYCNKSQKRCVKKACFGVKCKKGFYCSRGKCKRSPTKRPPPPTKKTCRPKCKKGFTCKGTKCVKNPTKGPVSSGGKTGPIGASVIQIQPSGGKSLVLLGRGKKHNVKVGDTGRMGGSSFKVIKVFATRCRVKVNAPATKLSSIRRATIVRK